MDNDEPTRGQRPNGKAVVNTPWMQTLKNPPGWVLLALLALLMAAGTAGSFWAAGTRPDPVWQGFWGGIATTCLGIFGTVFFVDQLLRRVEERRRSGLALHVRQRVSRIAFFETDKLLSVLQDRVQIEARPRSRRDGLDVNRLPDGYVALVEATIDGMEWRLLRLEAGEWTTFGRTIDRSALEYARLIALFGSEMDAEVLRLMLRAEESAHRLAGIMAMRVDMPEHDNRVRETPDNEASIMPAETRGLIAFHITRIMQTNVELLRRA